MPDSGPPPAVFPTKDPLGFPPPSNVHATVHRPRQREANALLFAAIVSLGASLAALAFGLWAWYFAMSTYGPAAVRRWTTVWLIAAPLLGIAGIACLTRYVHLTRRCVEAYPHGLCLHRGRTSRWIAWPEIHEIFVQPSRRADAPFTRMDLHLANGQVLRLTRSLADLEGLIQHVKQGVYPLLQDAYRIRFNRGESLDFGPLRLTPEGVQAGRKVIQWGNVRTAEVRAGEVSILADQPGGMRIRIPAARVPNVDVCVQIIRLLGPKP